jgi:hypothetical protein
VNADFFFFELIVETDKRGRLPLYSLVNKSDHAENGIITARLSGAVIPYSECRKCTQNFLGRFGALTSSGILIDPLTGVPRVLEEDGCAESSEKETSSIEKKKSKDATGTLRAAISNDSDRVRQV